MKKLKIFISSFQAEFTQEREDLFEYLHSDPLLGLFFEPYLFEKSPATACLVTGTGDIIRLCNEAGLKDPEFIQEEDFKTIIWRTLKTTGQVTGQVTGQAEGVDNEEVNGDATGQATGQAEYVDFEEVNEDATLQATPQAAEEVLETVKRVVLVLSGEMKRAEIQDLLGLRHRETFVSNYLNPSLESAYLEMTIPETPTHQEQRYRLTSKGIALKKKLQKSKKRK